ncbi:MAG: MBL fold metallo-hydrolase [Elusimicrobiota bacterium]
MFQSESPLKNGRLKIIPLQSSSKGNSIYVESGKTAILFDAGISASKITKRLSRRGINPAKIKALFLSHEHSDHIIGAGPVHRKYGFPLYATRAAYRASEKKLKSIDRIHFIRPTVPIHIDELTIHPIRTPHDCCEGVCFVIQTQTRLFGILTDIGKPDNTIARALSKLDAAIFESNYDRKMLFSGNYPSFLKKRISSGNGHLSNAQASQMIARHGKKLKWVCLAHISPENNSPELAYKSALSASKGKTKIITAKRSSCTDILYI